jgi:hypothetical protein
VYAGGVGLDKPADFDAILQALGAADAEPPPLMKKLLGDLGPPPNVLSAKDASIVAELEAWLAVLHDETPSA